MCVCECIFAIVCMRVCVKEEVREPEMKKWGEREVKYARGYRFVSVHLVTYATFNKILVTQSYDKKVMFA